MTATATKPRKTSAERKSQFEPEKFAAPEAAPAAEPPTVATDDEPDAERDALLKKIDALQAQCDNYRDKASSAETVKAKLARQEARISKADAALNEADARKKAAKAGLEKEVAELQSLVSRWTHGENLLPLEDPDKPAAGTVEAPAPAPIQQTTDEFGLLPIGQAKVSNPSGDVKPKLPKGFVEKCGELDPAIVTVRDLEALIGRGDLQRMKGVGPTMVDKVSDWVVAYRQEHPVAAGQETAPSAEPQPIVESMDWEIVAATMDGIADAVAPFADIREHDRAAGFTKSKALTFAEAIREAKAVTNMQRDWISKTTEAIAALGRAQDLVRKIVSIRDEANTLAQNGLADACEPCEAVMVAAAQSLMIARKAVDAPPALLREVTEWETELAKWRTPAAAKE